MKQMTTRVPETLLERIRRSAHDRNISINEFVNNTLEAATNPELEGSEAERIRGRLEAAGLTVVRHAPAPEPPPEDVIAAARRAAGRGTPLSDIVSMDRG